MYKATVLCHSSIKLTGEKTIYFDPFKIEGKPADADIIYVTHDHYAHYSEEDINKLLKEDTILAVPECLRKKAEKLVGKERTVSVKPYSEYEISGVKTETVAAYNVFRPFHPKSKGYVGYVVTLDDERFFIAGDTDQNSDNENVKCDVALVPIGGTYTMDALRAAEFVNHIKPKKTIPTHYGSIVGDTRDAEIFLEKIDREIEVEIQIKKTFKTFNN